MDQYTEYRCQHCDKLLFKGILIGSEVEIKCKGCRELSIFKGEDASAFVCLNAPNCPNRRTAAPQPTQG